MWILAAVGSAIFAGLTSILAKLGFRETDADVATALRTTVVLAFAWAVAAVSGQLPQLAQVTARQLLFLALSGLATGASWICYFRALSTGPVSRVVPIDKTSSVLTVILAIVLLGETSNLPVKLLGCVGILAGTLLMLNPSPTPDSKDSTGSTVRDSIGPWLPYAVGSAVFAALTSILAKVGIGGVGSNLATAIRTCFVLAMAWAIVSVRGKLGLVRHVNRRELGFLVASGVATGASWLCYYFAIQTGVVSVVVPIDKLSVAVSMAFAATVLKESFSARSFAGLALMTLATIAMAVWA